MTTSKARIAIRHLSGSKVNQIEQFDLADGSRFASGGDNTTIDIWSAN